MHQDLQVGADDMPPLYQQKIYCKPMHFLIGIDNWNEFYITYYMDTPDQKAFRRFVGDIVDHCKDRIVKEGYKSHIFLDQHGGFRSLRQAWKKNNYLVFHLTPKKAPWNQIAEWCIARIKNHIRKCECESTEQVLLAVSQCLRGWKQNFFLEFQRRFATEMA